MDGESLGKNVTLGHSQFMVSELPFRVLKRVLPMLNEVARSLKMGQVGEREMDQMLEVVSMATGKPVGELLELPIKPQQLREAIAAIADVSGLNEAPADPKATAAAESSGTISTPSSPPLPAGPGA
jgi:hypothetical protein